MTMPQSIQTDTKTNLITPTPAAENIAADSGVSTPATSENTRLRHGLRGRLGDGDASSPSAAMLTLQDRMAVFRAAKAIHRTPAFVMDFINHGLLRAFRIGGTLDRPRLAVNLSELLAVIDRETLYVPPAMVGRWMPRPRVNKAELHPLAAAI